MSGPAKVCDLLKVLHTQWLSVADLAADMDMDVGTASRWLHEMAEQGLLLTRQGERKGNLPATRGPQEHR